MNVLFIGDVVGKSGRKAVSTLLPELREKRGIGFCIANGENAAGGLGITPDVTDELFSSGVDVITTGNHIWDKKEVLEVIDREKRLIRPLNYPDGVPGKGSTVIKVPGGLEIAVLNISGRVFMPNLDCPFRAGKSEVDELRKRTPVIFVDIHAEATSEKMAFGWYLDGLVTAVIGTHTHVQTADEKILPEGTAYISDVGMTGSFDSVIGVKKAHVLQRFLTQMPVRFEPANADVWLSGVIVEVDSESGKSKGIERLRAAL